MDRLWAALHSSATGPLLLLVLAIMHLSLDRFPQWDEAVFLTQTAGRDGLDGPAAHLGPSREIGSVWYVRALTSLAPNFPNLRMLHIVVLLVLLAIAAKSLERSLRLPRALTFIVLGSYWLTFVYLSQLLRFVLLAFVLLLALSRYLMLIADAAPRRRDPIIVGLLFAIALLHGPFESAIVLAATAVHWMTAGRGWRTPRSIFAASATVLIAFGLPFVFESRARYGSLAGRIEALSNLGGPLGQSTFDWSLLTDYLRLMTFEPVSNQAYASAGAFARAGFTVAGAILILGLAVVARTGIRLLRRKPVEHHAFLISLCVVPLLLFLTGYYDAMSDRYFILPASLLFILGLCQLREATRTSLPRFASLPASHHRDIKTVLAFVGLAAFVAPNVATAAQIDAEWTGTKDASATLALARVAIADRPCRGFGLYNIPGLEWATGCSMARAGSLEDVLERSQAFSDDTVALIYWPTSALDEATVERLRSEGWRLLQSSESLETPAYQVIIRP